MRASYKVHNVEEVEATLSITMSITDWKRLYAQLDFSTAHPYGDVLDAVKQLVRDANQAFESEKEIF